MIENEQHPKRQVILAGLDQQNENFDYEMTELANLAAANNMIVVGQLIQKLERPNASTYFGKGKVTELKEALEYYGAEMVVTNDELSPSQIRNLEAGTQADIMDRTALILDIFASRAKTKIAKLQVAIAQLKYQLPRLRTSMNVRLDQQTGGGGGSFTSRGAGETKLEMNRRHIQHQISLMQAELTNIEADDETRRAYRAKQSIRNVALVGYTNAGKSTIMNALVKRFGDNKEKTVFQADMLFATLETSVRKIQLPDNQNFLLSDTVGFVSKLPHGLVAAFRATLAEAADADLLIQVVDYADPHYQEMMATTAKTLKEIGVGDIPMVTVYNKADQIPEQAYPDRTGDTLILSALDSKSQDALVDVVKEHIFADYITTTLHIPFSDGQLVSELNEQATVHELDYDESGTVMKVTLTPIQVARFEKYQVNE
ncbi:GTPase HflX [Weissella sagaensis]|uniref:GTPase HflX n=1 Tax=Weissella sagaensis TaxID=2559928 RepID=A0ABW1RVQ9_9LACO|nr:GTPase HflX [Weissella sagaensis]KAA8434597.1 GTPase HflX [Weissella paramesenteroides]QDJ59508.1 GTPase HflX [Weissella hellenica]KAA8437556.1 GTPase HflX [Weissella paramesenteroides]QEA56821.1 GTPase HflX [Weissella hellenica]UEG67634.1 GTPase HflX [Weissella hellenica]